MTICNLSKKEQTRMDQIFDNGGNFHNIAEYLQACNYSEAEAHKLADEYIEMRLDEAYGPIESYR